MGNVLDTVGHAVGGVVKDAGRAINHVPGGQYVGDALAVATGNPELVPLINGSSTYAKTGNALRGALSAGGSYLGANIGQTLGGNLGTVGGALDKFGGGIGHLVGDTLGDVAPHLGDVGIGSIIGGNVGNNIAQGLAGTSSANASNSSAPTAAPFVPMQQAAMKPPSSFTDISNLTPQQQASNIATQGVYGGGEGPQENQYYLNLINRQLVDPNHNTKPVGSLLPIEQSYLSQLGLGGYSNTNNLLQAIQTWQP